MKTGDWKDQKTNGQRKQQVSCGERNTSKEGRTENDEARCRNRRNLVGNREGSRIIKEEK